MTEEQKGKLAKEEVPARDLELDREQVLARAVLAREKVLVRDAVTAGKELADTGREKPESHIRDDENPLKKKESCEEVLSELTGEEIVTQKEESRGEKSQLKLEEDPQEAPLSCSGCSKVFYCSKDCMREHWVSARRYNCLALTGPGGRQHVGNEKEEESCKICVKEHDRECPVCSEVIENSITIKTSDITLQDMPTLKPIEALEESSTRSICHTKSSINVLSSPNKKIKLKPYPEPPKKPMNSFVVFQSKHRPNVEHEMPRSPKKLVENELAKRWGKLKPDDKAPYEKESNEDRERYYNEMKAYQPELEKAMALEAIARDKDEFQSENEGNSEEANVKDPFCTEVKEFFETTDLQMIPSMPPTLADGNCFFDSMASQVKLHKIPGVPQTHLGIRLAACDHLRHLPVETKESIINLFKGKNSIDSLAYRQRKPHQFVDNKGIMVLATADFLCRNIDIYSYPGEGSNKTYGLSRVDPSAELRKQQANTKAPLTVFLDNEHYQSIQKNESH